MFQDFLAAQETTYLREGLGNRKREEERLARHNAQRMAKNKSAVVLNSLRATVDSEKAALRATQERSRHYAAKAEWLRVTDEMEGSEVVSQCSADYTEKNSYTKSPRNYEYTVSVLQVFSINA
jgi:hypothetical protein